MKMVRRGCVGAVSMGIFREKGSTDPQAEGEVWIST